VLLEKVFCMFVHGVFIDDLAIVIIVTVAAERVIMEGHYELCTVLLLVSVSRTLCRWALSVRGKLAQMPDAVIAGLDEAGRGCLAGPVVAAACVYEQCHAELDEARHCVITDSKMLNSAQREEAYAFLTGRYPFGVGMADPAFIDEQGILAATEKAMHEALRQLQETVTPTYLLIDGRDHFWFDLPHSSVVRGDQTEPCISAASILAKVTRDRLMLRYGEEHPEYGFASHKGYGTQEHILAIRRYGTCPLHRKSFLKYSPHVQEPLGAFSAR
jgi:ribonuclease HII